jgi:hypothetical protein
MIHKIEILRKPIFRKVFHDSFDISLFFCSLYTTNNFFTSNFYETQNNKKKNFSKNYFSKKLNGNLTQIKPTKTNRSSVEHKVVLILSNQMISNIFPILLHMF